MTATVNKLVGKEEINIQKEEDRAQDKGWKCKLKPSLMFNMKIKLMNLAEPNEYNVPTS